MSPARFLLGSLAYSAAVVTATHWALRHIHAPETTPGRDRSPCADCALITWLLSPRT